MNKRSRWKDRPRNRVSKPISDAPIKAIWKKFNASSLKRGSLEAAINVDNIGLFANFLMDLRENTDKRRKAGKPIGFYTLRGTKTRHKFSETSLEENLLEAVVEFILAELERTDSIKTTLENWNMSHKSFMRIIGDLNFPIHWIISQHYRKFDSIRAVAKHNGMSRATVKRILDEKGLLTSHLKSSRRH